MVDSTEFPTKSVSLKIISYEKVSAGKSYYLSIHKDKVIATVSQFILSVFKFTLLHASFIEYDNFLLIYGNTAGVFA